MDAAPREESIGLLSLNDEPSSSDANKDGGIVAWGHCDDNAKGVGHLLSLAKAPWSLNWRASAIRLAWFLVPSFLQGHRVSGQAKPTKLRQTAHLDGMRGIAALFVYLYHHTYQCYKADIGWGADDAYYDILRLPFLRLLYGGPSAVSLFFVISGYALSYRPLKLIRSRNIEGFSGTMSSLIFRRLIRLFAPVTVSMLIIIFFLRIHAYEWTREFSRNKSYLRIYTEHHPVRLPFAWEQWKDWTWHLFTEVQVFGWDRKGADNGYDPHLWTIPVEYRCSLYLFLVLVGTARLKTAWRYTVVMATACISYRHSRWEFILFLSRMALAEWDHVRDAHSSDLYQQPVKHLQPKVERMKTIYWNMVSVIGLYLMSYPELRAETTPGWILLSGLVPEWWEGKKSHVWESAGAVIFTLAVSHGAWWRRVMNSTIAQYLGKISFSLYLIHGPIMHVIGFHLAKVAWGITGTEGNQYHLGFIIGVSFCIPFIFWRGVDIPIVNFAKWLEDRLSVKAD